MTALVPEIAALPVDAVLDGELVAPGDDGWPHFPLICERLLNARSTIPLVYVVFDVLELDGQERRTCRTASAGACSMGSTPTGRGGRRRPCSTTGRPRRLRPGARARGRRG